MQSSILKWACPALLLMLGSTACKTSGSSEVVASDDTTFVVDAPVMDDTAPATETLPKDALADEDSDMDLMYDENLIVSDEAIGASGTFSDPTGAQIDEAAEASIGGSGLVRGGASSSLGAEASANWLANDIDANGQRLPANGYAIDIAAENAVGGSGMVRGGASDIRNHEEEHRLALQDATLPGQPVAVTVPTVPEDTNSVADSDTFEAADQTTDESIGAAGTTGDCQATVVSVSANAVGDPCATTQSFMLSLGLSQDAIDRVEGHLAH